MKYEIKAENQLGKPVKSVYLNGKFESSWDVHADELVLIEDTLTAAFRQGQEDARATMRKALGIKHGPS